MTGEVFPLESQYSTQSRSNTDGKIPTAYLVTRAWSSRLLVGVRICISSFCLPIKVKKDGRFHLALSRYSIDESTELIIEINMLYKHLTVREMSLVKSNRSVQHVRRSSDLLNLSTRQLRAQRFQSFVRQRADQAGDSSDEGEKEAKP
jgi:hypothetical protein